MFRLSAKYSDIKSIDRHWYLFGVRPRFGSLTLVVLTSVILMMLVCTGLTTANYCN